MPDSTPDVALARCRSRYKGARPGKRSPYPEAVPDITIKRLGQCRDAAVRSQEERISGDATLMKPSYEPIHGVKSVTPRRSDAVNESKCQEKPALSTKAGNHSNESDLPRGAIEGIVPAPERQRNDQRDHAFPRQQFEIRSQHPESQPAATGPSYSVKKALAQRIGGHRSPKRREQLKRTISGPIAMEPPQSTVIPAFDAPISAVNAGERRVPVKCDHSTLSLPVTPSTNALDIVRLAAEQIGNTDLVTNKVVVESFRQLALERPLRRYEHVRDILNSWDSDNQNSLIIMPCPMGIRDESLNLVSVSKTPPEEVSVVMYHSSKPRQWNKRSITLRTDGQITIHKKDGIENICHLSDFDIYIPTARQLSKRIKPPRKLCFTIKSQQKSSIFLTTVNFVHFFSTSDKTTASTWYNAVQEWRSWYLVNVMGEGENEDSITISRSTNRGYQRPMRSDKLTNSQSKIPSSDHDSSGIRHEDYLMAGSTRSQSARPSSNLSKPNRDSESLETSPKHSSFTVQKASTRPVRQDTFAANSLLGRTYTQRQKAQQMRERPDKSGAASSSPMDSITMTADALKPSHTQGRCPKPLVDLTPQYREAPQHVRKGKGFIPERIPAGGLIEIATSPETAVEIPPATVWQRPTTSSRDEGSLQRSRTVHRDGSRGPNGASRQASTSPEKGSIPSSGGFLARTGIQGQGSVGVGKGVRTGDSVEMTRSKRLDAF